MYIVVFAEGTESPSPELTASLLVSINIDKYMRFSNLYCIVRTIYCYYSLSGHGEEGAAEIEAGESSIDVGAFLFILCVVVEIFV